jgi:anion-transporting  ArsA/GET3 family ATPase
MPARRASTAEGHLGGGGRRPRTTLAARLAGKRVCICAGPGGVGKTTIAAAVGMGLARDGQRVLVLTIDPARRLAGALGLGTRRAASGEPMRVDPARLRAVGAPIEGALWAMTLDVKRTFDDLIGELAPDERAREELLANRIYKELSSAAAGSQEVAAVAKLFELDRERSFDVVVLDTPPSRNALDFLEAPTRLSSLLEGRAMEIFMLAGSPLRSAPLLPQLAPKAMASRLIGSGTALLFSIFARATGVELAGDIAVFFRLLSTVREGLHERAASVEALLRDDATSFLIVTSPEHEPAQEAVFLHHSLQSADMCYGALVVNRIHEGGLPERELAALQALLDRRLDPRLSARVMRSVSEFDVLVKRDADVLERLSRALGERSPIGVPELGEDVDDLAGLARIATRLLG